MKKIFMLALLTAASSFGATVFCGVGTASVPGTASSVTCAGASAAPGNFITGITFDTITGYVGNEDVAGQPTNLTVQITYTAFATSASESVSDTAFSADNSPFDPLFSVAIAGAPTSIAGFTVNLTHSILVDAGNPFTGATSGTIRYRTIESPIPVNNDIPEPTTFALMGSALLGLGVLARRRS